MLGFLTLEKKYALCESETSVILADVKSAKKSQNKVVVQATIKKDPEKLPDIAALVAATGKQKAKVALVLPLKEFELVSVSVPPVSNDAITKLLPYSLSKVLDAPVSDYIYDWKIAQKFKDRYELTVFLYSAENYNTYKKSLLTKRKEITWVEPDVFAGCSYLHFSESASNESAYLFILAWENSVSMAIADNKRIYFVRNFDALLPGDTPAHSEKPQTKIDGLALANGDDDSSEIEEAASTDTQVKPQLSIEKEMDHGAEQEASKVTDAFDFLTSEDSHSTDILSGFGVHESTSSSEPVIPIPVGEPPPEVHHTDLDPVKVYIENLNLEILRTLDYHASVLKGNPVKAMYIGGTEDHFETIAQSLGKTHHIDIHHFPPENIETTCSQALAALCIGSLQR